MVIRWLGMANSQLCKPIVNHVEMEGRNASPSSPHSTHLQTAEHPYNNYHGCPTSPSCRRPSFIHSDPHVAGDAASDGQVQPQLHLAWKEGGRRNGSVWKETEKEWIRLGPQSKPETIGCSNIAIEILYIASGWDCGMDPLISGWDWGSRQVPGCTRSLLSAALWTVLNRLATQKPNERRVQGWFLT